MRSFYPLLACNDWVDGLHFFQQRLGVLLGGVDAELQTVAGETLCHLAVERRAATLGMTCLQAAPWVKTGQQQESQQQQEHSNASLIYCLLEGG